MKVLRLSLPFPFNIFFHILFFLILFVFQTFFANHISYIFKLNVFVFFFYQVESYELHSFQYLLVITPAEV